ncbi:hypothetical protein NC796_07465 [Aliifodinibius sp. S!AR15-10]|uniref:hypothetical protein n=1 Tax=Aliifodinibius sp. S!AR15-10 TaxID=2950437 RepID=UPI002857226B|nr:hypothetical protein [Aliifodinibius sp. S!AR15-10]MDR8390970.1 hypothetical protein [Aliifodinibius sp. S!AR15-10]
MKATKHFNNINDLNEEQKPFRIVDNKGNIIANFFTKADAVQYLLGKENRFLMTRYENGKYDLWKVTNIYGGLEHVL